jgi:Carbohydrate binding domain.
MSLPTFPLIQDQVSQLRVCFNAPLLKDTQVTSLSNLLTLDYNYDHRMVWVIEEVDYYYLLEGQDGSLLSHWIKFQGNAVITPYDSSINYSINQIVTYDGKIYMALQNVSPGIFPTNTDYWSPISSNVTLQFPFTDQSDIFIESPIEFPKFQTYTNSTNPPSLVEGFVEMTTNTGINGGNIWRISFEAGTEPISLTGYIILSS